MVRRDYGNAISVFQFTAAEPGPFGQGWDSLRLKPGDPCEILLGGTRVIKGSVTTRIAAYDAQSHDLAIAGKSLTLNLLSSVLVKPGNYNGSTFEQANRGTMAPHPVSLVMKNPPDIASKPFKYLAVQYGESVFEFAERTSKMRGMFLCDDADGNLTAGLGDANAPVVADLEEGRNIKRATCNLTDENLWSRYQASAQMPGDDENRPPRDNSASLINPNVPSNRVQLWIAEHPASSDELQARANIEAARSAWPSVDCSVMVVGWLRPDGKLWDVTDKISVKSPMLFPNETGFLTLGVRSVVYGQDSENGTTTTLEMTRPELLTKTPFTGVQTDPGGNIVDTPVPNQARPDTPDTAGVGYA